MGDLDVYPLRELAANILKIVTGSGRGRRSDGGTVRPSGDDP
jgi:hypothetical protein